MSQPQSYVGVNPITIEAAGTALARGVRCTRDANGNFAVTAAATRGDMVTLQAIALSEFGAAASAQDGAILPIVSLTTANVGDAAYGAADGKVSTTSTNAAIVGRYRTAVAAANTFGEVQLLSVL